MVGGVCGLLLGLFVVVWFLDCVLVLLIGLMAVALCDAVLSL